MQVWRLCKERHGRFDGEGARLAGGRWNYRGTAIVYASATLSMAVLEFLVNHHDFSTVPGDLVAIPANIPKGLRIESVTDADLPPGWRRYPAPEALANIGTEWVRRRKTSVLVVPSVIVPREQNYLINPAHPDFRKIRVGKPGRFPLDPRLRQESM